MFIDPVTGAFRAINIFLWSKPKPQFLQPNPETDTSRRTYCAGWSEAKVSA